MAPRGRIARVLIVAGLLLAAPAAAQNVSCPPGSFWTGQGCTTAPIADTTARQTSMREGDWVPLLFVSVFVYFIPMFVTMYRNHPSRSAIVALNLLLGWTVLGWVIALVWALTGRRAELEARAGDRRPCPHCAEPILAEAQVCRFCGRDVAPLVGDLRLGCVAILALTLTGCGAGLQDIKAAAPVRATLPGHYEQLALCLVDGYDAAPWLGAASRYLNRPAEQAAQITGFAQGQGLLGPTGPLPAFEILLRQAGQGHVTMEYRSYYAVWRRKAWPIIERCAGQPVAASS